MMEPLSRSVTALEKDVNSATLQMMSNEEYRGGIEMSECNQRETNLLNTLKTSKRSYDELRDLRAEAINGKRLDFADGLQEIIDQQYPQMTASPTSECYRDCSATFRGTTRVFKRAVHAYIWLVESMVEHLPRQPELLNDYVFQRLVAIGKNGARYFADTPEALFPDKPGRAGDSHTFHHLKNGWYLNLNLSNKQKDDRLYALAHACALEQGIDWSWTAVSYDQLPLEELLAGLGLSKKNIKNPDETNSN